MTYKDYIIEFDGYGYLYYKDGDEDARAALSLASAMRLIDEIGEED